MRVCPWILVALFACSSPPKPTVANVGDGKVEDKVEPEKKSVDPVAEMMTDLAGLHFDRLGNPVLRWDHIPPVLASKERPHKLLVLLVAFSDRGFDRFKGDPQQARKLADWYQQHLFDDSYRQVDTLSHYYATQSLGEYHVTGTVLPPIEVSKPRPAYGAPHRPVGGDWRNDADPQGLVAEALALAKKANPNIKWADYDRWDPTDHDGDKSLDEGDGYIDHFVLVFAGGGQASCEGLQKVRAVLTPNVGMDAVAKLDDKQRECADRIWPHRSQVKSNDGMGPTLKSGDNRQGGTPLSDSLWVRDYNMQSEYVGPSTFIHEFGHSIGLPDVYARTSSNSTGSWEVMSATTSPSPQNMSAWSRLMLGWLEPMIVMPPVAGGDSKQTVHLRTLDDPTDGGESDAERAVMVVLPPKKRVIDLGALPASAGEWALYSGQGNDLQRSAVLALDLKNVSGDVELSFDAWWEIEGGWDFAYVEVSADGGRTWTRQKPVDPRHMPAKHGHDGKKTRPGLTGLSGDLDGDGKNESNPSCDPTKEMASGEDKANAEKSPCLIPTWVRPAFSLSSYRGKDIQVRFRYYTDGAAVMNGLLIDNVSVSGLGKQAVDGDFEDDAHTGWTLDGFSKSTGKHELLVPHYYLIEYRDPYAHKNGGPPRYDAALDKPRYSFYGHPNGKDMMAVEVRSRPGVVIWYYNGAYAWSENDPAINGPGNGYLLAVDANHNEISLPGLDKWLSGTPENRDTHYSVASPAAQKALESAYTRMACLLRSPDYLPRTGLSGRLAKKLRCGKKSAAIGKIVANGRPLRYTYEIINELLPGPDRDTVYGAGELLDTRTVKGKLSYRLRDRSLRNMHTRDAPLSLSEFPDGVIVYRVGKSGLEQVESRSYPARTTFSDRTPERWKNAKLPFGGVALPTYGLSVTVEPGDSDAPEGTRARVQISWD